MMIWPLSGTSVPASTCISVDLPAPLWPTSPTHSPASTVKSTPSSARTAPKCFSTPSSLTMFARASAITGSVPTGSDDGGEDEPAQSLLHVSRDGLLGVVLRVFVAGDATLLDSRQRGL